MARRKKTLKVLGKKVVIRPCVPGDIERFFQGRGIFTRRSLDDDEDSVAVCDGECVGHAMCNPKTSELLWLIVHPDFREQGIGGHLVDSFSVPIKKVKIRDEYEIPRKFYENLGFVPTLETEDFRGTKLLIYVRNI